MMFSVVDKIILIWKDFPLLQSIFIKPCIRSVTFGAECTDANNWSKRTIKVGSNTFVENPNFG